MKKCACAAFVVLWQIGSLGCGSAAAHTSIRGTDASPDGATVANGAGIFTYIRNDLQPVQRPKVGTDSSLPLVSMVVGLTGVEIIHRQPDGTFTATPVVAPPTAQCVHAPVGLAVMDVDIDGRDDIVVLDLCENWVALDDGLGGYTATRPDKYFANLSVGDSALVIDDTQNGAVLVESNNQGFECFRSGGGVATPPQGPIVDLLSVMQTANTSVFATALYAPSSDGGGNKLLLQGYGSFAEFHADSSAPNFALSLEQVRNQRSFEEPYLSPFWGLDHLQLMPLSGCPDMALAVGKVPPKMGPIPLKLQVISFPTGPEFTVREVKTSFEVTTMGLVSMRNGHMLIGVLGFDASGAVFSLVEVTACDQWQILGSWPTEFDWRTPDAPAFGSFGPRVPKSNGIRLLGMAAPDGITDKYMFTNYDGFDLRIWEVTLGEGQAPPVVTAKRVRLHATRMDISFAN